jgi:metal-responsive CopG/Arc/MetJ family transcriptional regulator
MSISSVRTSRAFTISFPENLAKQVEDVAREEDRNISELFREAFRSYKADRIEKRLVIARSSAKSASSDRFTKEDVEAFVDEVRSKKGPAKATK